MPRSPFEDSILVSLRRISRAIDIHSRRLMGMHQLTAPQLVCLLQIGTQDEITPSELARRVSLSQATITGILDRLAARELIERERSVKDRRRVMVRLTDAGRRVSEAAPSPLQEQFAQRLAGLSEVEQAGIDAVLRRIVEMMEANELDASPMLAPGSELEPGADR
jgi:DNA-binding MarR family transcriptional regulator